MLFYIHTVCTNGYGIFIATSVDVKRVFSKGHILLSHICNRMLVQSTCALICVGAWSRRGYIEDSDVNTVASQCDLEPGEAEPELQADWAKILVV